MMEGNDVYSLKNIIYMIKMCTYKGTEEQPRMQANDVDSLKHETYVYWLHVLKRARNNDQPEAIFNSRPRLNHLKTFPIEWNQTSFQVWVGIVPDESRPSSHTRKHIRRLKPT